MRALLALPLLVVLAACDTVGTFSPEGAVRADGFSLTADRSAYDDDDVVRLTLRNDGSETGETGVLGCAVLERRTEAGWSDDLDANGVACIALAVYVEPGDELTADRALDGLADGTYRFTHGVSGGTVATASFEVR